MVAELKRARREAPGQEDPNTMATATTDTEARTATTAGDRPRPVPRLLCSLVGHRWVWEGRPGAADCRRRCLRCDGRRPAWRRGGPPHPTVILRVGDPADEAGLNLARLRDGNSTELA